MRKLKVLPAMACDDGCGDCCGPVPVTESEYRAVERFVQKHAIAPALDSGTTCPFFISGTCAIYTVRPLPCRVFGHVPRLTCSRGHNVNVDERQVHRMIASNGRPVRFLHELVPNGLDTLIARLGPERKKEA